MRNFTKITVVTVVKNGGCLIESTIKSVLAQLKVSFQYIIIDGVSKDLTCQIVKKYRAKIDTYISEPDLGIYDAMNKSIKMANGDWIIFMNAGDIFFNKNTLENVVKYLDGDLVYGNHAIYKFDPDEYECASVKNRLDKQNIPFCHQSVFVRREILQKFPFDLKYRIASDYDQYLRIKNSGAKVKHVPITISKIMEGGVSSRSRLVIIREYFDITKKYWPIYASFVYLARVIKYFLLGK